LFRWLRKTRTNLFVEHSGTLGNMARPNLTKVRQVLFNLFEQRQQIYEGRYDYAHHHPAKKGRIWRVCNL